MPAEMTKEDMVKLHGMLGDFYLYMIGNVRNDRDGSIVEDAQRVTSYIEELVNTMP